MSKTAINPTRDQDFNQWYQEVIKAAELAENSVVRGCMVIRPWGFGIWERIQRLLDDQFKATGHVNAYFPLLIPLSFLEKEADHVDGFAKECAVVTHHRLTQDGDKLVPDGKLEEPLIIRPTSETIIGDSFSKWVQSYRDLPLLVNQWANVMRWEMRTRIFLRTSEFLWQEGHTAHATEEEARAEVQLMHKIYTDTFKGPLAMPVIPGEKPAAERFPGAIDTFTNEAMMQDGKALQSATSHYLGTNFAKASNIKFLDTDGEIKFAHTTSWGASTRMIGAIIMTHSDDDGLRLPPQIAPQQVVLLPVIPKKGLEAEVLDFSENILSKIRNLVWNKESIRAKIDKRDIRGGEKNWQWVKKGCPLRIEIGPRDIKENKVVIFRRDQGVKEKHFVSVDNLEETILSMLSEYEQSLYNSAKSYRDKNTVDNITSYEGLKNYFSNNKSGFVIAKYCPETNEKLNDESKLKDLKLSIRCIPEQQSGTTGKCLLTGSETTVDAIYAKAY